MLREEKVSPQEITTLILYLLWRCHKFCLLPSAHAVEQNSIFGPCAYNARARFAARILHFFKPQLSTGWFTHNISIRQRDKFVFLLDCVKVKIKDLEISDNNVLNFVGLCSQNTFGSKRLHLEA
jgi:hypothetical protein